MCSRREHYLKSFLNVSEHWNTEVIGRPGVTVRVFERPDQSSTIDKVEKAWKRLISGRAIGLDGVTSEFLSLGGKA